jgi:hypothetical protein
VLAFQGQAVYHLGKLALVADIKCLVARDGSESPLRVAGQITKSVCEAGRRVIALDGRDMPEQRNRMVMAKPVILGTDERRDLRRGDSPQGLFRVGTDGLKVLQQPRIVSPTPPLCGEPSSK